MKRVAIATALLLAALSLPSHGGDLEDRIDRQNNDRYRQEQQIKLQERRDKDRRLEDEIRRMQMRDRQEKFLNEINKER